MGYSEGTFLNKLYDELCVDGYEEIAHVVDHSAIWVKPNSSIKVKLALRNIMIDSTSYLCRYKLIIAAAMNAISYWQKTKEFKLEYEVV